MTKNLITAPTKYAPYPGNADLVYDAICKVLSERQEQVAWATFTRYDWQMLVMMAKSEGVGPLLHWHLGKLGQWKLNPEAPGSGLHNPLHYAPGTCVPDEVALALKTSYYQTAANNAVLFKELERILAAFEEAEIPVIVLKGAALAQTLYPDPGLRPMGDLDLLVRPDDLVRAAKILRPLGYVQEKVTYHAYLRGTEKNFAVEIHWSQVLDSQGSSPGIEWLWAKTDPYFQHRENQYIKRLRSVAQYVYLTGHLMLQTDPSHRRLIWFYDLYQLYMQHLANANWEELFQGGTITCWRIWLQAALYQLRDLFGVQLPVAFPANQPLQLQDTRTTTRNYIQNAWQQLDPITRLLVRAQLVFPPKSYLVWRYTIKQKWLWPLYLPRRWWEMGLYLIQAR